MMKSTNRPALRPVSHLAVAGLALAVAAAVVAMLAGFGSRWGWWHFGTGFDLLGYAVYGAMAAAAVCVVGAVTPRLRERRGAWLSVVGIVICAVVIVIPWQWRQTTRDVPPIHDITTDTEDPPGFVAIAPLRADAPNPVEYPGEEVARQQRAAYPELRSLDLDVPPDEAFERAYAAARQMGWEMVDANAADGRIEATDRTFWFGFYDDVVIRVTATPNGARVDVRSKSRVGGSDVGTNARRIERYLERVW